MSVPFTIEKAIADTVASFEVGADTVLRCWHGLQGDYKWNRDNDRVLPCVDIRCEPQSVGDDGVTCSRKVSLTCMSNADDDRDHAQINGIEDAVQSALNALYSQFRLQSGVVYTTFRDSIQAEDPILLVCGLMLAEPSMPFDDSGVCAVGMSLIVSYSRSDY